MATSLEEYKSQRTTTKRNISRIKTIIDANGRGEGKALSTAELKCRLGILESYFKQILVIQSNIEKLEPEDTARGEIEDLYVSIKLAIQSQLGEEMHNITVSDTTFSYPVSHAKLPSLELPTFDGKYSNYQNFITSFRQIIDRETSLSNVEKFNHLRKCLKGAALETVNAFQVSNENYPKALERLRVRYDNNTLIFMENITSLFQINSILKPNASELRSLVDNVSALYSSLLSLGNHSDICNAMLIYLVMEKVDEESQAKWKESLDFINLPTWENCAKVLERRCQFLESIDKSHSLCFENRKTESKKFINKNKMQKHSFSMSCTRRACPLCSKTDHMLHQCSRFKLMDVAERFAFVKRVALCVNCLSKNHKVTNCTSTFKCKQCAQPHHTLLHRTQSPSSLSSSITTPIIASNEVSASTAATVHTHCRKSSLEQVILATALVLVRDAAGCYQIGRALLDSCSQVNLITEEFAQKLRLPREKHSIHILSIGESHTNIKHKISTSVKSRFTDSQLQLSFCVTSHILYQPESEIDISTWNLPPNTQLADDEFFKSKRINLLLGTESFFDILSVGQIRLGNNLPSLQKTLLGWIVSGRYKSPVLSKSSPPTCLLTYEETVDRQLEYLWKLDEMDDKPNKWTDEQTTCEQIYLETVSRNSNGRVVVRLPFKGTPSSLGLSYPTALRRFKAMERRLARDLEIKHQYVSFLKEYEELGHMSLVRSPKFDEPHYYIPHHCVLKPTSTSTKLRVVFDASCQTTSQKSLNDLLLKGPTIQDELYILLIRFRLFRYAITADIVKMYRQVLVDQRDRRFQYILWRNSEAEPVRTYQLNTVTYGTAAAPFLAVRSLQYLADQYESEFRLGARVIKSSFYVDDFLGGAETLEELAQIKKEVTAILKGGCMELAKWHSNHRSFRDDRTVKDLNIEESFVTSALGIKWDQSTDLLLFSFNARPQLDNKCTKRKILSLASSLFDPLGLLSPLVIVAKTILQELWLLKINWDESIPQNLQTAWEKFVQDLALLPSLEVPRYCLTANAVSIQLHGFCDASNRAYGCCIYLRVVNSRNDTSVNLLTAKSRVAPTKQKSLPKLELCGAHLLSQLYSKIKSCSGDYTTNVYLWTDSQIVLYWLKQHSSTLSTFVGNRISQIQDLTASCQWRHVPTSSNPADIVSRGSTVSELADSIWYTGPPFLLHSQEQWPQNKSDKIDFAEVDKEKRKSAFHTATNFNYILEIIKRYSSHMKILRIVAWMFRFYKKLNRDSSVQANDLDMLSLSPQELESAMLCIVWNLQQRNFKEDIRRIQKKLDVKSSLKFLNPFLQPTGGFQLLRVGGRLELASMLYDQKHPIILPSSSDFVEGYVRHLHVTNYHAGAKALVALIRLRFWIVNARNLTRRIVRSCTHCIRYRPRLLQQVMGNLPVERLNPSRPFSRCAVDFCGPINTYVRIRGKVPYKTYVAIFVCLSSKAVHIEVVSDLSTEAFIAALKRMIGRRGLPTDIFCDNATNFVGASNQLADLKSFLFDPKNQNCITNFCTNEFINFRFIPPRAPHFGGLWEAAVKSAKGHLLRTVKNARLTFEELTTAMVEIEAILNSRPISPLSSDPSDVEALTPGHFLVGSALRSLPERQTASKEISQLDHWVRISAIKQRFWQQWSTDYLRELQARNKWTSECNNIVKGTLVIVHEDNVPPQRWVMGRVTDVIPGKDQRIRVVDVQTAKGLIRRPIHKLALLTS